MKMKKKYKVIFSLIILVILVIVGFLIYNNFFKKAEETENPITNVAKVTNQIEGYQYTLDDRDSELFGNYFKELKTLLEEKSEITEEWMEEYAKYLAQLFIIDLYTIQNKISKYDIGGLEYLYENATNSFRSKVLDTIYKTVEDDSYKTRTQALPIVKSISIQSLEQTTYLIEETEYKAYEIKLSWDYETDLGYDQIGTIKMIEKEEKLYIVSYEPKI